MLYFIFRKSLFIIPALFVCSFIVFMIVRFIPGDPIDHLLGERGADPQARQELLVQWGLDKPLIKQYGVFMLQTGRGELGNSIVSGRPVLKEFMDRFPATMELALSALLFALILGLPLGFLSALKVNSIIDFLCSAFSLTGYSLSVFWWGLILILVFSVNLDWLPVSGRISALYDVEPLTGFLLLDSLFSGGSGAFLSAVQHLILPVLALGTIPLANITRMTRFSLLETFKEDYIRTAKAKGLSFYYIYVRHAFRNALLPVVTTAGLMAGALITGAVLTETVFAWPGIGRWLVQAVLARDYPVLQGGIMLITFIIIILNLLIEVIYFKIDPRTIKDQKND